MKNTMGEIATTYFKLLVLAHGLIAGQAIAEPQLGLASYDPPAPNKVRISRDHYGVPHVVAGDNASLYYGAGYAVAEDQLERLALNYLAANGRSAEVLGFGELQHDILVRSLGLAERAAEGYAALGPERKAMIDAYAAGINRAIGNATDRPDWVEPVRAQDCIAFSLYVNSMFAVEHCMEDLHRNGIKLADRPIQAVQRNWGSNQFAIAPQRSATGACLLSMDPHLPHSGFFRWHEMHLVGPHVNAMGASLVGLPFIGMGRTETTAWCMTVNSPDLGDVFQLELDPKRPGLFRTSDGWEKFVALSGVFRIKTDTGTTEQTLTILRTRFGPVVARDDKHAYTIRIDIPSGQASVEQGYRMMTATNLTEFKAALDLQGLLMFNLMFADKQGDIFYVSNGRVARRDERINSHQVRPAAEAWADWTGIHAVDDLPQVTNPSSGYLLNTNSGPQNVTSSEAPDPSQFPAYMIGHKANSRSRRLAHLLSHDESITWDEMLSYATDTRLELDQPFAKLVATLRKETDGTSETMRERIQQVLQVLDGWDRRADLNSKGTVLFYHLITDEALVAALKGDDATRVRMRATSLADSVQSQFGSLDVAWQEFSLIQRGDRVLGVAGWMPTELVGSALRPLGGVVRDGKHYCGGGSSYGMLVDFAGATRSVSCLPFGVSEVPESKHFDDMLPLFCQRKFKPTWFLPDELKQNTESEQVMAYQPTEPPAR